MTITAIVCDRRSHVPEVDGMHVLHHSLDRPALDWPVSKNLPPDAPCALPSVASGAPPTAGMFNPGGVVTASTCADADAATTSANEGQGAASMCA